MGFGAGNTSANSATLATQAAAPGSRAPDPTVFQADKLQESLAIYKQSQRDPINSLTSSFPDLRIQCGDIKLCTDIIQIFRDVAPKPCHDTNFETAGPFMESVESIDFTMALLNSLPQWLLYYIIPYGEELVKALGVSVQTALLDEFWDSCANLLGQVRETSPSLDYDAEQYVQNLLLQRVTRLGSLPVNRTLMELWVSLQPMVHELISELQDCIAMPKFTTEIDKKPVSPPTSLGPAAFLRTLTPPPSVMPRQPESRHQSSLPIALTSLPPPSEYSDRPRGTSTFRGLSNIVSAIKIPNPVLLPPAHILCYGVLAPGNNSPSLSTSPVRRETTELRDLLCIIRLSDEFI
ncbi:hypothetical protein O1611_g6143 [Lasiodiplodia mahajangana]|uniref:Uncharacterized protein n=1 Tax=Lasiodiplodia mahajangana TaxID=1108764 RepID=A0ACC2JIY2_9PEZI|nr:hypothetical protein O1611_g6143 [Lasiodiplodia mahajangana]